MAHYKKMFICFNLLVVFNQALNNSCASFDVLCMASNKVLVAGMLILTRIDIAKALNALSPTPMSIIIGVVSLLFF
jgi:hypothetical protein